jgi:beta-glucosidase-like glycosyl hydrolase
VIGTVIAGAGRVTRVPADFAPRSPLLAGTGRADHVRAVERTSAAGLHQRGVGLNFAPVADVRTNPRDQVILDRSFGSNPRRGEGWLAARQTGQGMICPLAERE